MGVVLFRRIDAIGQTLFQWQRMNNDQLTAIGQVLQAQEVARREAARAAEAAELAAIVAARGPLPQPPSS